MRLTVRTLVLCATLIPAGWPQSSLDVEDYCAATLKAAELAQIEWKDRISLAQSHQGSLQALHTRLQSLDSQYARLRNQVYAHFRTTFHEHLRYGASHQAAIQMYLEENPAVKAALEEAGNRVQALRQQMDALMGDKRAKEVRK